MAVWVMPGYAEWALTYHRLSARPVGALRAEAGKWGGGKSDSVLLLNRNWNEAKYFQMSPDPPHGAAGSRTISATPNPLPFQ